MSNNFTLKLHLKSLFRNIIWLTVAVVVSLIFINLNYAQDTTKSLAFKDNHPFIEAPYFYRPDLGYQIWQQFKLTREANSGDVLAQHELGLRYLLGEGVPADTSKAVYWIRKAAEQNLASAKYNYAILLINGWGVEWNPFQAFKYFREAAKAGMIQAQYVVGILYTDNLIVKRDMNYAYYWVKKSSGEGYEPAKGIVNQIKSKISTSVVDSITAIEDKKSDTDSTVPEGEDNKNLSSPVGLVFIDFNSANDTVTSVTDSMLINDLRLADIDSINIKMQLDSVKHLEGLTSPDNLVMLTQLASSGSPEAQTILGRLHELGISFIANKITAAAYYFQALRNDSPKASFLLWKLSKMRGFIKSVQELAQKNNPKAMFVWYGLNSVHYDNQIAMSDGINLLHNAGKQNYIPALIELGLNYYTGRFTDKNTEMGLSYWHKAESLGSLEAKVRIMSSTIYDHSIGENLSSLVKELLEASEKGSLLALVTLAHCYENGIGTAKSKSKCVEYYRDAAQRGSQYAYRELKRLYDEIRPPDPEFMLN